MINDKAIRQAFKLIKEDMFTLRDRIEETKKEIKEIKKEVNKIDIDKFEKKFEDVSIALEKNSNLEEELTQRIDTASQLAEEKLRKDISKLKKEVQNLKNEHQKPLLKKDKSKEQSSIEKKKGFFSKLMDFLAEEKD